MYEISTDELLTGKNTEVKIKEEAESKKNNALILSVAIFLYFFAVAFVIFTEEVLKFNDGISATIFLIICAIATCLLIYNYNGSEKKKKIKIEEKENKLLKQVEEIITSITLIIYLIISFITMAWHITWILWIINVLVCEIVKLIFMLKGEEVNDEE